MSLLLCLKRTTQRSYSLYSPLMCLVHLSLIIFIRLFSKMFLSYYEFFSIVLAYVCSSVSVDILQSCDLYDFSHKGHLVREWFLGCISFNVPLENFSFIWRSSKREVLICTCNGSQLFSDLLSNCILIQVQRDSI